MPKFVIQKHEASRLHYDFRLEMNGTLRSWAIPKGPSTDPSVKRLAVAVQDHDMEYADFEGVIPEGEYGAGTVIVWDTGEYELVKDSEKEIEVNLYGEKLKGGYVLVRTSTGKGEKWLLIKRTDKHANREEDLLQTHPESVLSGKTNKDLEK